MGGNGAPGCDILSPTMMDNSTAFSTLGAFIFMIFLVIAMTGNANFEEIQNASLKARLSYSNSINVSICCLSMCFHFMHVLGGLLQADHGMLNKMSFFEYMMTCPWMMLVFVLLGGPKVQGAKYRTVVMSTTVLVLLFGFIASLVHNIMLKITCFTFGAALFAGIIYIIDRSVLEHSEGKESLFKSSMSAHASWYKALAKKIFITWILFPIWWIMSPEGFALATDSHDVDAMVKLFLNCFAKGLYVVFIRSLQARFKDETETLPVSHPAEKDPNAMLENFGKYSDEQNELSSSNNGDLESGPAVLAVVAHQHTSSTSIACSDKSFVSQASTRCSSGSKVSTRSSSKENLEDICKKHIEERQASFMALEAPSMPSERQFESEEQPPPSDTWQEFQCVKIQMEI